jgi:hypothetical protein
MSKASTAHKAILYLYSRALDQGQAHRNTRRMESALLEKTQKKQVIVPVNDWYEESFPLCSTWDSWIHSTVKSNNPVTGGLRFIAYVFTEQEIGKGNAEIASLALTCGRKLYFFDLEHDEFRRVTAIATVDSDDYVSGWRLVTAALEPT